MTAVTTAVLALKGHLQTASDQGCFSPTELSDINSKIEDVENSECGDGPGSIGTVNPPPAP